MSLLSDHFITPPPFHSYSQDSLTQHSTFLPLTSFISSDVSGFGVVCGEDGKRFKTRYITVTTITLSIYDFMHNITAVECLPLLSDLKVLELYRIDLVKIFSLV